MLKPPLTKSTRSCKPYLHIRYCGLIPWVGEMAQRTKALSLQIVKGSYYNTTSRVSTDGQKVYRAEERLLPSMAPFLSYRTKQPGQEEVRDAPLMRAELQPGTSRDVRDPPPMRSSRQYEGTMSID